MHTLGDTEQQENELSRRNEKVTNAVTRRVRQSEMRQRDGNDVDWSVSVCHHLRCTVPAGLTKQRQVKLGVLWVLDVAADGATMFSCAALPQRHVFHPTSK